MSTMSYTGRMSRIEFDDHSNLLVSQLAGITDIVSLHADTDALASLRLAVGEELLQLERGGTRRTLSRERAVAVLQPH